MIENITLAGNGNNFVVGSAGANVIVGGTGIDVINGGAGADTLTGGAGADVFVFANSADTVGDLANGVADRITDFTTTADVIRGLGVAGADANEFTAVAGTTTNTYANALTAANAVFAAANAQSYFMTSFGTDGDSAQGVLFLNMNNDATADGVVLIGLAGAAADQAAATALLVAADILA